MDPNNWEPTCESMELPCDGIITGLEVDGDDVIVTTSLGETFRVDFASKRIKFQ